VLECLVISGSACGHYDESFDCADALLLHELSLRLPDHQPVLGVVLGLVEEVA
jgi:hypothetical protein